MKFVGDFHIHSKYSRAVSREMDFEHIDEWAKRKGIQVVGTGDFTHPAWFSEIKEKLEEREPGLFSLKGRKNSTRFLLTAEISSIYSKGGRVRKIHNVVFAPDLKTIEKINTQLGWIGNLKSDGRPILGLDAKELLKTMLNISEDILVVPAHAWTPWFSIFGAKSGFDSIEECFEDLSKYIYAIETGLSSDPAMNWRLSALDKINLISNSDAHSPSKLGREANIFDTDFSYAGIIEAIKGGRQKGLVSTIEFFPEEGKYHFDGHRNCGIRFSPRETIEHNYICPKCGRRLTVGVMHRIEKLADRKEGAKPEGKPGFISLIPLEEIIAAAFQKGPSSKAVQEKYLELIEKGGNELRVLLKTPLDELKTFCDSRTLEGIRRVREKEVKVLPGYDGEYGKIKIFNEEEAPVEGEQAKLL